MLDRARWDADAARDQLREYVLEELSSPDAVLIADETGFLKKGMHSVGVKRQYTGTAGRIENSQVGVFLCYASGNGAALLYRELYLPEEWAADGEHRRAAAVPDAIQFATKPELARRMIERALEAGAPCNWVAADEEYGNHRKLRQWLEQRRCGMCWLSLQTKACAGPIMIGDAWMRLRRTCRTLPGSAFPRGRAAMASGCATGRGSRAGKRMAGATGCWYGAA